MYSAPVPQWPVDQYFPQPDVPGAFDCYGDWSIWPYVQLICLHSSTSPLAIMISCSLSNCIYPVELTIKLHQVLFKCCLRIVQHRMLPCQSSTVPLCPIASLWYFSHHLKVTLLSSIWVIISKLKPQLNLVPSKVKPNLCQITWIFHPLLQQQH